MICPTFIILTILLTGEQNSIVYKKNIPFLVLVQKIKEKLLLNDKKVWEILTKLGKINKEIIYIPQPHS